MLSSWRGRQPLVSEATCQSLTVACSLLFTQKYLLEAHESGVLVPAVQSWAQHPVTLPTGLLACVALAVLLVVHLVRRRTQPIYLLDFECFRPGGWGKPRGGARG